MSSSFVARALEAATRQRAPAEIIAITVPAMPVAPDRLLVARGADDAPILFWDASAREREGGGALAGWGEAARVEGSGPERLRQVIAEAERLFAQVFEVRHPEAEGAPSPRLFGGLSFRPEPRREAPWAAFGDASFVLPRLRYAVRGGRGSLQLCARVEDLLREDRRAVIVADFERAQEAITAAGRGVPMHREGGAGDARIEGMTSAAFCELVEAALAHIRSRALEKVVAVAPSHVTSSRAIDIGAALVRMGEDYGDCTRFAIQRGDAVFVGASPERLVARSGRVVETDGLAGTARRGANEEAIKDALFTSAKERREHAIVVEAIARVLESATTALDVPAEPVIRTLRNVHHLWTPIRATLRAPLHVLSLVESLHPTPAVCGTPREDAVAFIAQNEPSGRGWYTGAVGWLDGAGDGDFAVAIRAGLVGAREAWLYAGAGIVEGSDPRSEFAETRAKQAPMLTALGIGA
ncbi:isochorismate synthase [Polyangium aurulentum]|uniref:isochorismate synthase n=1 Tax=Polyangium aurulentum TaxID=2567896 RepID=UPI0010ADD7E9|nr:isochorismate synthase [Polyangium aurulentum]UQA57375.1 isochorismate synthase [Polyangium aurulentum]